GGGARPPGPRARRALGRAADGRTARREERRGRRARERLPAARAPLLERAREARRAGHACGRAFRPGLAEQLRRARAHRFDRLRDALPDGIVALAAPVEREIEAADDRELVGRERAVPREIRKRRAPRLGVERDQLVSAREVRVPGTRPAPAAGPGLRV